MKPSRLATTLAATAIAAALPLAASAQVVPQLPLDVTGGYMHLSDGTNAGAAAITLHGVGISANKIGVHPQITLLAPLTAGGGRYALTAEGALHLPLDIAQAGVGVGIGRLAAPFGMPLRTGTLYDAFASAHVAPHVHLEARYYAGLNDYVGQGEYVGLVFHL